MRERSWRVLLLLVLIAIGIAYVLWAANGFQPTTSLDLPFVVVAAALLGLLFYVIATFRDRTHESAPELRAPLPYEPEAIDLLLDDRGRGSLTLEQAATFIASVVDPKTRFMRISESAVLMTRSIKIATSMTVDLSQAVVNSDDVDRRPAPQVLPVYLPLKPRGRHLLVDGLRVTVEGQRSSTLDARRSAVFAAAVVRALVRAHDSAALKQYLDPSTDGERAVWGVLSSTIQPSDHAANAALQALRSLPGPPNGPMLEAALNLVRQLAFYHAICVVVPVSVMTSMSWPFLARIGFERRTAPRVADTSRETRARPVSRIEADAKLALGVPPRFLNFELEQYGRTDSLHVEVVGPPGTYQSAGYFRVPPFAEEPTESTVIETPLLGQRRGHVQLTESTGGPVVYVAEFSERAPGSFATTTVVALGTLFIVALLALTRDSATTVGKLLPALLAAPIAIAALANTEASRLERRPELLSRVLTVAVVLINIAAFAVAVLEPNGSAAAAVSTRLHIWTLISWCAIMVAVVSVVSWLMRVAVENHFRRRNPDEE